METLAPAPQTSSQNDERLDYLESTYRRLLNSLDILSSLDDFPQPGRGSPDLGKVFGTTHRRLEQLVPMDKYGFFVADDAQLDFPLAFCVPEQDKLQIEKDISRFIDDGTFAWALNQTRAITFTDPDTGAQTVLHALATRERVIGMFMGVIEDQTKELNEVSLMLLSVVLLNCSYVLETTRLNYQVAEHNAHLEEQIQNRTQELQIAKELAEQSAKAKSEFLSSMSHEIRTPLNGIMGMINLLKSTPVNETQQRYLKTANNSCDALLVLINDILDFSKIEAGRLELEEVEFDLRSLTEDVLDLLSERAHAKSLELVPEISSRIPARVVGDPTRVRQILINLVSNAIKFTESGFITLRVRLESKGDENVGLRFEVVDTGIGIAEEAMSRMFQSFSQADSSTTRKYGGTGLGLAICKRLVEAMQGSIGVESELGHGSTFWFKITLASRGDGEHPFPIAQLRGTRVLYALAHNSNSNSLQRTLSAWGLPASPVESVDEILEQLARGVAWDVVLIDADLLGTNIQTFAHQVHQLKGATHLPVVAMLPFGAQDKWATLQRCGYVSLCTKPLRQDSLHRALCLARGLQQSGADLEDTTAREEVRLVPETQLLVVDDNETNREVAVTVISAFGPQVGIACNGLEAVEAARATTYDLIFMDCQMPEMDGYEATRKIREFDKDIPIIAMTADILDGVKERCRQAGMDDYISKPVNFEALQAMLAKWLPDRLADEQSVADTHSSDEPPHQAATSQASAAGIDEPAADDFNLNTANTLKTLMGREKFADFMTRFIATTLKRMDELRQAQDNGDSDAIHRLAHSLKGSTGNIGATKVSQLCHELCYGVQETGVCDTTGQQIATIASKFDALKPLLERLQT